jgi:hypothetical protein
VVVQLSVAVERCVRDILIHEVAWVPFVSGVKSS